MCKLLLAPGASPQTPPGGLFLPPGPPPPAWVDASHGHGLGHQKNSIQLLVPEPSLRPSSGSRGRLWNGLHDVIVADSPACLIHICVQLPVEEARALTVKGVIGFAVAGQDVLGLQPTVFRGPLPLILQGIHVVELLSKSFCNWAPFDVCGGWRVACGTVGASERSGLLGDCELFPTGRNTSVISKTAQQI